MLKKKKSAMKGTTKDNIKFHMEEIQLRKMKLRVTISINWKRSVTQINKYRHIYRYDIYKKKKRKKKVFNNYLIDWLSLHPPEFIQCACYAI